MIVYSKVYGTLPDNSMYIAFIDNSENYGYIGAVPFDVRTLAMLIARNKHVR